MQFAKACDINDATQSEREKYGGFLKFGCVHEATSIEYSIDMVPHFNSDNTLEGQLNEALSDPKKVNNLLKKLVEAKLSQCEEMRFQKSIVAPELYDKVLDVTYVAWDSSSQTLKINFALSLLDLRSDMVIDYMIWRMRSNRVGLDGIKAVRSAISSLYQMAQNQLDREASENNMREFDKASSLLVKLHARYQREIKFLYKSLRRIWMDILVGNGTEKVKAGKHPISFDAYRFLMHWMVDNASGQTSGPFNKSNCGRAQLV